MSFARLDLDQRVADSLLRMGYRRPRPIQAETIPNFLQGRDIRALAPTGTGKTMAFLAPVVHQLLESRPPRRARIARSVRAIVLCPTRELARQVAADADRLTRGLHLAVLCVHGKVGLGPQIDAIAKGVDLLVATPGRLIDLLAEGAITLEAVHTVILDEADRMLDMGFRPQVEKILARMRTERQVALFTATMPRSVDALAEQLLCDPVRIDTTDKSAGDSAAASARGAGSLRPHVRRHLVAVHDRDKIPLLLALVGRRPGRGILVFCRTRRRVGWVGAALRRHGIRVGMIHGDRTQAQRTRDLERLADGTLDVVVATDVASRGLHVPSVDTVISYDVPLEVEEYVHRTGRAGHGGARAGVAYTLLSAPDRRSWKAIAAALGETLPEESSESHGGPASRAHRTEDQPTVAVRDKKAAEREVRASKAGLGSEQGAGRGGRRGGERRRDDRDSEEPERRSGALARGRRRRRRSRPVDPNERPGGGVRR